MFDLKNDSNVTVIILNYKTYEKTEVCINSILYSKRIFNIIVIDNDIVTKRFENLKAIFKNNSKIHFVSSNKNLGYAQGNNFAINWAKKRDLLSKYIAIINNDIEIKSPSIFYDLVNEYESNMDIGVISPKIIHKSTGLIQGPYKKETISRNFIEALFPLLIPFRIKSEQKWRNSVDKTCKVYRTMGSFLIINSELFKKIGYFDSNTFLGSEEEILSEKLKSIGKSFYYFPNQYVLHDHGSSTSLLPNKEVNNFFLESKIYYFKNYIGTNSIGILILKTSNKIKNFWKGILI